MLVYIIETMIAHLIYSIFCAVYYAFILNQLKFIGLQIECFRSRENWKNDFSNFSCDHYRVIRAVHAPCNHVLRFWHLRCDRKIIKSGFFYHFIRLQRCKFDFKMNHDFKLIRIFWWWLKIGICPFYSELLLEVN